MKKRMRYVLGKAPWNDKKGDYDPRPVNKQILVEDGNNQYVQMEKMVARSLEEFRKAWPKEPVTGAPTADEVALTIGDLSDEQLAAMGLQRTPTDGPEDGRDEDELRQKEGDDEPVAEFENEETAVLAAGKDIAAEDLLPGGGSGEYGRYTIKDVRALTE